MLNCPSSLQVKDADVVGDVAGCFAQQHVYVGGPVENHTFLALHTWGECDRAHEIITGLYTTDVHHLNQHVAQHGAVDDASRPVKVMAGYAGWAPYQLAQEVRSGSWWIVAASKDVILDTLQGSCKCWSFVGSPAHIAPHSGQYAGQKGLLAERA